MKLLIFTDSKTAHICILSEQDVNHEAIQHGVYSTALARTWVTTKEDMRHMLEPFRHNYLPVALVFDPKDEKEIMARVFTHEFRTKLIYRAKDLGDNKMERHLQKILKQAKESLAA
jgi:hypothetical protein